MLWQWRSIRGDVFTTQKQKYVNTAAQPTDVILERTGQESSLLIEMIFEWMTANEIQEEMEIFTTVKGTRSKLLTPKHLRAEIKNTALELGLNPARFSNHSTRKGYATAAHINNDLDESAKVRAGWSAASDVPHRHYVLKVKSNSGLSYRKQLPTKAIK